MSTSNPYAAPKAAVADVYEQAEAAQPVRMWSGRGRIGRLRFLAHGMAAYLMMILLGLVLGLLAGAAGGGNTLVSVGIGIGGIAYFVFVVLKLIQRSHDMDWSGWTVLLAIIPLVGLIWIFKGGSEGTNRFGAPAPANTLGVKLLALLFPVIAIVGIVAAIAIPAYGDYANRAKAVQVK